MLLKLLYIFVVLFSFNILLQFSAPLPATTTNVCGLEGLHDYISIMYMWISDMSHLYRCSDHLEWWWWWWYDDDDDNQEQGRLSFGVLRESCQNQKHLQITIWWWDEHVFFGFPKHRFFANLNLLGWLNGTKKRRITQGLESKTWETLDGRCTRSCPYPFCLHAIRKCQVNIQGWVK